MTDLPLDEILIGDAVEKLKELPENSVDMCVTSPPYWALRNYNVDGQLGLEKTPEEYINNLCSVFDEVKRVLKKEGSLWVNLGDTYGQNFRGGGVETASKIQKGNRGTVEFMGRKKMKTNRKPKSLVGIPFMFVLEMLKRGWILRNTIIWYKPNVMPSSAKDRFTVDFEYLFFFVKNKKYYFEQQFEPLSEATIERVKHPFNNVAGDGIFAVNSSGQRRYAEKFQEHLIKGRNKRTVWRITTKGFRGAHFAVYPEELVETPIKAGCPVGGVVLDPFFGSGTTGVVALKQGKHFIGIELNPEYVDIAKKRLEPFLNQRRLFNGSE